jgi:long-chain acyl-CoA synthetase
MAFALGDVIRKQAAAQPDAPIITFGDKVISYGEMHERSSRVANALIDGGTRPQDHVAFLDKNSPEYFEVLFGCTKSNMINVAVNWRLAPPEIAHIVNDAQAKVFIVSEDFVPALDAIEDQLTSVEKIIVIGKHDRHLTYEDWLAAASADDPAVPCGADDVVIQLYTSGTTGLPKGAMLTNGNLGALEVMGADEWGFRHDAVNLVVMPLFHIAGGGWALVGMTMGCHSILMREVDPAAILGAIPRYGITHALFVPAVLQFLVSMPGVDDMDFSTLELIVYGASPISEDVLTRAMKVFQCKFVQAYGLSETTGGVVLLRPDDHDPGGPRSHLLRSCGKPIDGCTLRIVDENGGDAEVGQVGEIWIRSPQNMKGYWNMPEATASSLLEGNWFRSGDAGYLDADGYLYIYDRVKDMIISGGENIYPAEIENVLMSHPQIADAAVIGVPDDKWGEAVRAVIVKGDASLTEEGVLAYARERLAGYKCPKSVTWADELPRNPSGKILKRELRDAAWAGQQRQVN